MSFNLYQTENESGEGLSGLSDSNRDLRSPVMARLRRGALVSFTRAVILLVLDIGLVLAAWEIAISLGKTTSSQAFHQDSLIPLILIVNFSIFTSSGLYRAGHRRKDYVGIVKAISLSSILLLSIAYLYNNSEAILRPILLLFWLLSIIFVCVGRFVFDFATEAVRRRGQICYPVFLISYESERQRNANLISQENRYRLIGYGDATCLDLENRKETFAKLQKLGISEVFVSWQTIKDRLHLCWHFQNVGITLRILPTETELLFAKSEIFVIGGVPSLTVPTPAIIGSDYWLKRLFDWSFAIFLLLIFSPIYLLIAILIRIDSPGPIFFRQTRIGLHGRQFKVWKFRTMVVNAAELQKNLEALNQNKDGVLFKIKDDPRITRLGRFLRRYSLDELPQVFNVLLGEMSFVGPRPLPIRDVEKFQDSHFIRQEVLPGITGLWQVSGRSDIDNFDDVVRLDASYIETWSIWMDISIILRTVLVIFQKKGAY